MVGYGGKHLQKRKVLSLEWKSEGVMDDESGESMEPMEEVPLIQLGEAELERLVRGWRRRSGSWFQRWGEACWKERSVIRKEDDVDGRASVTKDEERVLRGGWTVVRLCRYEGWVRGACIQCAQLSSASVESGGWEWCDWIWELWQQHVRESSGSVGAGWSETWAILRFVDSVPTHRSSNA